MTIREITARLERRAPASTAEEWDNVGLLIGDPDTVVTGAVVALDATSGALETAQAVGANLLITHHPVIFSPLKRLGENDIPYRAAQMGIRILCAHTNLDKAPGGVNDELAARLGLTDVRPAVNGNCRIGSLPIPVDCAVFAADVARELQTGVRVCGEGFIGTVAVCGGSGGEFMDELMPQCDLFVTGEVRHHQWIAAQEAGFAVIEAGHYATEQPVVDVLYRWLQEDFPMLPITLYDDGEPYIQK